MALTAAVLTLAIYSAISSEAVSEDSEAVKEETDQKRGADIRKIIDLTFEEAAFGCHREMSIQAQEKCETCGGSGAKRVRLHKLVSIVTEQVNPYTTKNCTGLYD